MVARSDKNKRNVWKLLLALVSNSLKRRWCPGSHTKRSLSLSLSLSLVSNRIELLQKNVDWLKASDSDLWISVSVFHLSRWSCLGRRVNSSRSCCMELYFICTIITFERGCCFWRKGWNISGVHFNGVGGNSELLIIWWPCIRFVWGLIKR